MKATRTNGFSATLLVALAVVSLSGAAPFPVCAKEVNWDETLKSGNYLLSIGEYDRAATFFNSKLKKYPNSGACHTGLGRAYKKLGKLDQAKQEFKIATESEADYADGFYELGVLKESDKEWGDAAQAFERYLTLRPDNSQRRTIEDRIKYCKGQQ